MGKLDIQMSKLYLSLHFKHILTVCHTMITKIIKHVVLSICNIVSKVYMPVLFENIHIENY